MGVAVVLLTSRTPLSYFAGRRPERDSYNVVVSLRDCLFTLQYHLEYQWEPRKLVPDTGAQTSAHDSSITSSSVQFYHQQLVRGRGPGQAAAEMLKCLANPSRHAGMSVLPRRLAVAASRPVCCAWCRNRAVTVTAIAPQKQKPGETYEDLRCGSLTTVLHSIVLQGAAAAHAPGSLTACALILFKYCSGYTSSS
jgi:hypothetical protein